MTSSALSLGLSARKGVLPLPKRVAAILRKFGSDAHLYMPGPGVPVLGPELATDIGFDNPASWMTSQPTSGSVQVSGSKLRVNSADGSVCAAWCPSVPLTNGKRYSFTLDVESASGSASVYTSGGATTLIPAGTVGSITLEMVADGGTPGIKRTGVCDLTVRSMSVKEILGYTNYLNGFAAGNYLESTGNTNAALDGAVGLVLDAAGSVGAELMPAGTAGAVIGAPGALPNGWQGGVTVNGITRQVVGIGSNYVDLRLTGTATSTWADYVGVIGTTISVTPGETYRIEMPETTVVGGTMPSGGGITYGCATQLNGTFVGTQMGRSQHVIIPAGVNQLRLFNTIANYANGAVVDVTLRVYSTVSAKKVTGTHATQATTANKPILRRGIVNLLTYSNDFTNAIWVKGGGNFVGDTFTATGTAQFYQTVSVTPGMTYTFAFKCRKVDMTTQNLAFYDNIAAVFIQDNVSYISRISNAELSIVTATVTVPAGCTSMRVYPLRNSGWTGESAKFESAGLFQGTLTAQQILAAGGIPLTTTAPASSSAGGFKWEFKAANLHRLQLGAPLFQMANDHCVVASGRTFSATNRQVLFAQRALNLTNPIACEVSITNGYAQARWRDDTGAQTLLQYNTPVTGQNVVIRAQAISGIGYLYVNGVLVTSSPLPAGAATIDTATIGAAVVGTGGFSDFFDGEIIEVTPIKGTLSAADVKNIERMHGNIAGVSIA